MTKLDLLQLLGWCSLIYIAILFLWIAMLTCCRAWMYRLHGRWLAMSEEKFNQIHYALIGLYKLIIIVFFLVPYIVLRALPSGI